MGVFPRRNATLTTELFTPLAEHLQKTLGQPVRLETAKDFDAFWQGVETGRYDLVHYNQYHYVNSADRYTVIVCNEEQGRDTIAAALYVRRDSGITEISQLRGQRIIFGGGQDAMMSYIVPQYLLLKHGLSEAANDYQAIYASNPLNAVLGVYFRQADAGGAGDVVMSLPKIKSIVKEDSLRFLQVSEPIRHLPWVVSNAMPVALREQIRRSLVELEQTEQGRTILKTARLTGFTAVNDSDYESSRRIIEFVREAHGELAQY